MRLRPEESGQRLDVYLAGAVEGLSRSAAQRLIADGLLTLDGAPVFESISNNTKQVSVFFLVSFFIFCKVFYCENDKGKKFLIFFLGIFWHYVFYF